MKRNAFALAAIALVSTAASAQSSVTLYGIVDAYVGSQKSGVGASSTAVLDSGGLSTSRLGFKGTEDLGGGLSAIFGLEAGLGLDVGQSSAGGGLQFNRGSYVGLEGGFGTFTMGNVWTALDDVWFIPNAAFDSSFAPGTDVLSANGYNAIPGNTFKYVSPDIGGLVGSVSYKGKGAGIIKQTDFSLQYGSGPFTAAMGYQQRDNTATNIKQKITMLMGTYDLGVATLRGGFSTTRNLTAAKTDEWQIGADVPLSSNLTISGGYASSEDDGGEERTGYGIAAIYSLSKRTDLYAGFRQSKAELGGAKVDESRLMAVGVRHSF